MDSYNRLKILAICIIVFCGWTANLYGQNTQSVAGKVLDAQSMKPLPGVNIKVKGTTTGTTTNAKGRFSLNVPSMQDTLIFSYIGYKTKNIPISGRTKITVKLASTTLTSGKNLVVVGYTKKKKQNVTGAVSQVSGSSITETPVTNTTQSLEGKTAGLVVNDRGGSPGNNNASFLIRGNATLGNNSPLFIIDGVPRGENAFSNLSPDDIKSISVLKGASAAIYGARAANGVVLVTTKKGQAGHPTVTLNSTYGWQSITKYPHAMTAYQRAKYFNEFRTRHGQQPLWSASALQHFKKGDMPYRYPNTNWSNLVLANNAPQNHQDLSVSGGDDNVQYYISGDYLFQGGMYKSNSINFHRYQMRARVNSHITDHLSIGLNIMGREGKRHDPITSDGRTWQSIIYAYPWLTARWPNGSLGPGMNTGDSPITNTNDKYGYYNNYNYTFNSKVSATYKIPGVTGLQLSGYANFNYVRNEENGFSNTWTAYNYSFDTKKYTPINGHSRDPRLGSAIYSKQLEQRSGFNEYQFYHIQLTYKRSFGKNNIHAFVAAEQTQNTDHHLMAYRKGLPSAQVVQLFAGQNTGQDINGYANVGGRVNYFGNLSYNYASTYMFDFTLRDDGSFNFPKGHRFGIFPSVSAGWNIANEPFMNGATWLSSLKLRGSWGKLGNDRVPPFQFLSKYSYGGSGDNYSYGTNPVARKGMSVINTPNPNITWEVAYKTDIGIDLSVLNDELSFTGDIFKQRRRGILIHPNASVPDFAAISVPDKNLGKVNNRGFEATVNFQKSIGNLSYSIGGNMTYHKSKIIYMNEAPNIPGYQKQTGHPLHSWLVYKALGLWQSQQQINNNPHLSGAQPGDIRYADINGDGKINGNDMIRKYTSPIPKIQYGFNIGLNYKGFGLNVFFQGQAKAQQLTFTGEGLHLIRQYFTKRWTPQHKSGTFPRAFSRDNFVDTRPSTFWLYNASFLRLKTARLSYTIPERLTSTVGINHIKLYVTGRNLLTWDHMLGNWDPEIAQGGNKYQYPQMRTIMVGTNIKF